MSKPTNHDRKLQTPQAAADLYLYLVKAGQIKEKNPMSRKEAVAYYQKQFKTANLELTSSKKRVRKTRLGQ